MTGDEAAATVVAGARRTIALRSGSGSQYLRTTDGSVAGVAEFRYDLDRRAMSLRQRFRVEDDLGAPDDPVATDWVDTVIDGRSLYLLDDEWTRVSGAGLSASPVAVVFWLAGAVTSLSSESSPTRRGWTRHRVLADLARAVDHADDPTELADGLREAGLSEVGVLEVEVSRDASGALRRASYVLGDESDRLAADVELDHLGDPQRVDVPERATDTDADTLSAALLDPED